MNKEKKYYINYPLNYTLIYDVFRLLKKKKINFFVDFNSICKGFYKKETIMYELNSYVESSGKVSGKLILELRQWLNNLYSFFRNYEPYFIIFY